MDSYLVDYLKSGKAWLLVGSGPSIAMGYPDWHQLALAAINLCKLEVVGLDSRSLDAALAKHQYEEVFEIAARSININRLLQHLRDTLQSNPSTRGYAPVYEHLARWPVAVYLTTNFDHEIAKHLAHAGETSFIEYSNTEDDLSTLLPDISGSIVQLHGDLRSQAGLILTSSQYRDILFGQQWQYWRTKLTSIFQMNRVIVVGHSLYDPHVKHVLEAAKKGAGVIQPVCWIAPDVPQATVNEYLEKYRIRVITYDNRDNSHRNLVRLIETLTDFAPPRLSVHISQSVARVATSPLGSSAAAPGFFVFTKLSEQTDFETKQTDAMVAAIRAVLLKLQALPRFSIQQALEMAGWPPTPPVRPELAARIADHAIGQNLLSPDGNLFAVRAGAENAVRADQSAFQHLRNRFQLSVQNRLGRTFPTLTATQVGQLASDIDASLTGYFREGGLTLASSLTAQPSAPSVPTSVIRFISEASAKYDQHLLRQAFSTASLECFIRSDPAEREYLGRVSQGFFAFHLLGVFGDAAMERLRHAKDTIWLVDSSAQIAAIAVASAANAAFGQAFQRLSQLGIRLFTTDRLFDETREHLWFANRVVSTGGPDSPNVIAAARGDVPYRKANLFLEGFINWRAAGNPADWDQYLTEVSGQANVGAEAVRGALRRVGIEAIAHSDWPGFTQEDHAEVMTLTEEIVGSYSRSTPSESESEDLHKKAKPEAEAFIIIFNERSGKYHMLTEPGQPSPAWFLSQTAILNAMRPGPKITWQPEAFFRFAATLAPASDQDTANRAFETLLWGLAQSGVIVLDDRIASAVFGGIIDQAKLSIVQQHAAYEESLSRKYGESIESVLERVPRLQQPLAALQLANERAESESGLKSVAQAIAKEAVKRAETAETELSQVQRFRRKLLGKQDQAAKRKRKARSGRKKKR